MVRQGLKPIAQVQSALAICRPGTWKPVCLDFGSKMSMTLAALQPVRSHHEEAAAQRRDLNRRIIEAEEDERRRLLGAARRARPESDRDQGRCCLHWRERRVVAES